MAFSTGALSHFERGLTSASDIISPQRPDSNLVLDSSGNLYGTTNLGGAYGYGVVFEITP